MMHLLAAALFANAPHEADCPLCKLKLIQNTEAQDNEVVVRFGNKRIEYRCVTCIVQDQARYKSDLVVYAPSEKVGEPVILKRTAGKWTAPAGTVFLFTPKKHLDCAVLARAFQTTDGLTAYAKANNISEPKSLTLAEFLEASKKPIPLEACCVTTSMGSKRVR